MIPWRLVKEDGVAHDYGLAADEVMAVRAGEGTSPPTLRLYTYAPCALVGRFQTLGNEIHLDACQAMGLPVNRRPTGGGAIVMGPDQLGVALTLPGAGEDSWARARETMARFSLGLTQGLAALGIQAAFRGKNDIEAQGRKLAGLGIYRAPSGGMLFHASLLVGLDVAHMLRVLNTPFEKITDKEISQVAARTATVRELAGRSDLTLEETRERVADGYRKEFGVSLSQGAYTPEEQTQIRALQAEKYTQPSWVHQTVAVPDTFATAREKTPAGLLEVRVTRAGAVVKAVYIGGDFFAPEGAVADLEARLRWHSADPAAVEATLRAAHAAHANELAALPLEPLAKAVATAVRLAGGGEARDAALYGCFLNPDGQALPV